ncbi:hypothetical protein [Aquabacterium sp. OR-4]|uniref:hypothetical protein n=1 Tax=Aquabacterium sp. OR-4 TaxID=2978127 RepID=UPI0021B2BECB|nr:hypothetical protein [Aquabacterium sp. OR-4]MDT7838913.1 hypothetical protein [Aquabacterium sp. OR-4]
MTTHTPPQFAQHERHLLLSERGIGQLVVQRLESAGIHSLEQLRREGVERTVRHIGAVLGSASWCNRQRALERALLRAVAAPAAAR